MMRINSYSQSIKTLFHELEIAGKTEYPAISQGEGLKHLITEAKPEWFAKFFQKIILKRWMDICAYYHNSRVCSDKTAK
jgi:hypothetical protein